MILSTINGGFDQYYLTNTWNGLDWNYENHFQWYVHSQIMINCVLIILLLPIEFFVSSFIYLRRLPLISNGERSMAYANDCNSARAQWWFQVSAVYYFIFILWINEQKNFLSLTLTTFYFLKSQMTKFSQNSIDKVFSAWNRNHLQ